MLPELQSQGAFEADSQAVFASQGATAITSTRYGFASGTEDGLLTIYNFPSDNGDLLIFNIAVYHAGIGFDIQAGALNEEGAVDALAGLVDQMMLTFAFTQ